MSDKVLISIITINYNNLEGLKRTVESVVTQTWQEFEYIIIDGGSTDGSAAYIESQSKNIDYWLSEPDSGIYNAMNKGIKVAKGEYLLFLNSGDTFYNSKVFENVALQISNEYGIYYGDVQRIFKNDYKIIKSYDETLTFSFFIDSAIAHQSAFIKKRLFSEIFYYSEDYKILADWEFLICAICKHNIPYKHLGLIISNYDMNGISSQPQNKLIMKEEREKCYKKHFPLFSEDYLELMNSRLILNSDRMKLFMKIEENATSRKLNYFMLRLLNKLLK